MQKRCKGVNRYANASSAHTVQRRYPITNYDGLILKLFHNCMDTSSQGESKTFFCQNMYQPLDVLQQMMFALDLVVLPLLTSLHSLGKASFHFRGTMVGCD